MKTVYDAIHGFIPINQLENAWLKTPWFLRLQSIHQLGAAYRVFPGATHSRFEHSLGVMHLATKIFDHIFTFGPNKSDQILEARCVDFYRRILRLAALSHDLGHLPFSHTAEELVLPGSCHEAWTLKILDYPYLVQFLNPLIEEGKELGLDAHELLKKMAVGEKKYKKYVSDQDFLPMEKILSEIITGDFFGADRMDYLLRDSQSTGLSYGIFDHEQLIMSILVEKDPISHKPALMIDYKGIQACESLLTARYFMYQRVYLNPKVLAYGHPIKFLVQATIDLMKGLSSVENYLKIADIEVLALARSEKNSDPDLEKYKKAFFDSDAYEMHAVTQEEKIKLLSDETIAPHLEFVFKQSGASFFAPSFYVKTHFNQIKPFSECSRLKIPMVYEDFVLFERALVANVFGLIHR